MYYYNLHYLHSRQSWHGVKLMTISCYKTQNLSFEQMRNWEHYNYVRAISNGGWHLSYFGDINFIKNKIQTFSHQEFNNDTYINDELVNKVNNGLLYFDNSSLQYIDVKDNPSLPYQYEVYLSKYI